MAESNPKPYAGPYSDDDLDLFGEYRSLYPIEVLGRTFWVPEDNSVLRVLQYIEIKDGAVALPYANYCWNDTDGCCEMRYRSGPGAVEVTGRACVVRAAPGLQITRLPKGARSRG